MGYRQAAIAFALFSSACGQPSGAPNADQSAAPSVAALAASPTMPIETPGPYWVGGPLCGEDDCDKIPGRWRAFTATDLYAQAEDAAPAGRIAADEWVNAAEKKTKYTPQRGVVQVAGAGLAAGDVVYGPFPDAADGHEQVWRNGKRLTIESDAETPKIAWDELAPGMRTRVMWVRVERTDGTGGWLRDPDFACMGEHPASDEGC